MFRLIGLLVALSLPAAATAQVFQAVNRLQVVPLNAHDFEVIEARGEGARGMWCAAADYAQARFGNHQQRIYVKSPRGPSQSVSGRKGAVFTTDAARLGGSPSTSLSVTVRHAGVGLPLNHAIQFCKDYQIELEDILLRRN